MMIASANNQVNAIHLKDVDKKKMTKNMLLHASLYLMKLFHFHRLRSRTHRVVVVHFIHKFKWKISTKPVLCAWVMQNFKFVFPHPLSTWWKKRILLILLCGSSCTKISIKFLRLNSRMILNVKNALNFFFCFEIVTHFRINSFTNSSTFVSYRMIKCLHLVEK